MSSRYLDMLRNQRRRGSDFQFTSKTLLAILALIAMAGSAVYWWGVQSTLIPGNTIVALAFTAILVLAPPSLVSFLIPWSPAGMLLQKVNARTSGYVVIVGCSIYLLYYSFQIQWSWWDAQQVVHNSELVYQQVLIGMIGFIVIPALLWTPVSSDELVEQVRQAHLVKRYELQTQADIAILRATLLRAQEKALVGFANLTVEEREELAAVMRSLVGGIDRTLREVGQTVKTVSGVTMPFDGMLDDNEDLRDVLEYISESLTRSTLTVRNDSQREPEMDRPSIPARHERDARLRATLSRLSDADRHELATMLRSAGRAEIRVKTRSKRYRVITHFPRSREWAWLGIALLRWAGASSGYPRTPAGLPPVVLLRNESNDSVT